jgi:hypothetical protein
VPDTETPDFRASETATPKPPVETPGIIDTVGAAFRQDNPLTNVVRAAIRPTFAPEPDHNPMDVIRGTRYGRDHSDKFLDSQSTAETNAIVRRIDEEEADRRILDAAGFPGFVAQVAAGVIDPTIAFPAGQIAKAAKGGYSVVRSMTSVGAAAALQTGAQEAVLQAIQETRTAGESGVAIASSTLLGGLIGGGAARLLTAAERRSIAIQLDVDRAGADLHVPAAADAGAAATDTRRLELAAGGGVLPQVSPTRRVLAAESVEARRAVADTFETPYSFKDGEGPQGATVERLVRMQTTGARVQFGDELNRLYGAYRFGDADISFPNVRAKAAEFMGKSEGMLSPADFRREVAVAVQNGGVHDIPQVAEAAAYVRDKIFEPWAARAESAIEGFKRVEPDKGEGYFPHIWNKEKVRARRPEFVNRVLDYLKSDQTKKAAAKQRLEWSAAQLKSWSGQIEKYERRLETIDNKGRELIGRLKEREVEATARENRVGALDERAALIGQEISEIEEFVGAMRAEVKDPALLGRLDQLQKDAAALRREDKPMTEAQLRAVEQEELQGILTGETRMAAEMLVGRRKFPKVPSFITWLVTNGGVKDNRGDLRYIMDNPRARPGLLNDKSGRPLDRVAEMIQEQFEHLFPRKDTPGGGAPDSSEILEWIGDALRGREPAWWEGQFGDTAELRAGQFAHALDEAFHRAGIEVKKAADVAKVLQGGRDAPMTLDDLDRVVAEMEAVGQDIPASLRRADVEEQITVTRQGIADLRAAIDRGRVARGRKEQRLREAGARGEEAELAERQNRGRLGVIEDRLSRAEARRELIEDAILIARQHYDDLRVKIEEEIGAWEGKSAAEAKSALKSREAYAEKSGRPDDAPRLKSADDAIDKTLRKILEKERDLSDDELRERAHETADRILSSPDGRLPYDMASGGPRVGFRGDQPVRGSLAGREFMVSNAWARDWIEDDIERVVNGYLRTVVPDVLLTEKHGDVEMTQVFRRINEEYAAKADATKSEAERTRLGKERDAVIRDVAGMRDRVRGVYGWSPDTANMARVANAAKQVNNLTSMGVSAISSLPDMAGAIFRWGIGSVLTDGWTPFLRGLTGKSEAFTKFKSQMRAIGIGAETAINARQHAMDDVMEAYRPQSPVERGLQWASDKFFIANLQAPQTDAFKTIAAHVAVSEILKASQAAATGKASKKQLANLIESGIDANMATKIAAEFGRAGEVIDGVRLPNTADWTDRAAADALNAAVARETDIAVVTPGQEKPLWMSKPVVSVFGQFKAFTASANERILIAGLQRRDAATLQGLVFSAGLGMLSYKLNSVFGGVETSDRPQDWFKEGISRGGVLGWIEEGNALASKVTRGSVDVYRAIGADKPASRFVSRSALDMLLGPTAGKVKDAFQVGGSAATADWQESDTRALRRLMATQNLFYLRGLFNMVEEGANRRLGIQ